MTGLIVNLLDSKIGVKPGWNGALDGIAQGVPIAEAPDSKLR